jgi:hypothetical protein
MTFLQAFLEIDFAGRRIKAPRLNAPAASNCAAIECRAAVGYFRRSGGRTETLRRQ